MNQPPEQIALFGENHRARVGQSRAADPPAPKPFDPHGGQLAMFMTPNEIKTHYQPLSGDRITSFSGRAESDTDLWTRKAAEADQNGLTASIAKHGVVSPVQLQLKDQIFKNDVPEVLGGHHRIAAAPPDSLIPVIHHDDFWTARADQTNPYERAAGVDNWQDRPPPRRRPVSNSQLIRLLAPAGTPGGTTQTATSSPYGSTHTS